MEQTKLRDVLTVFVALQVVALVLLVAGPAAASPCNGDDGRSQLGWPAVSVADGLAVRAADAGLAPRTRTGLRQTAETFRDWDARCLQGLLDRLAVAEPERGAPGGGIVGAVLVRAAAVAGLAARAVLHD